MPLRKDGIVEYELRGKSPQEQLQLEIKEMRSELKRIETVLSRMEALGRSWGAFTGGAHGKPDPGIQAALKPQFHLLFGWYLSAMESFISLTWLVFGKDKTREVVLDFMRRFQNWRPQ